MKICIISDTHGYLEPNTLSHLSQCDEIWHAGDIGNLAILQKIESLNPLIAVYGNIDGHEVRAAVPENQIINRLGVKILITHIAATPPSYNKRVLALIKKHQPNILVCGHSHILKVEFDKVNNLLFINPGAAGKHGFHKIKTLIRFEINNGKPQNMEVVELGSRGNIHN